MSRHQLAPATVLPLCTCRHGGASFRSHDGNCPVWTEAADRLHLGEGGAGQIQHCTYDIDCTVHVGELAHDS